MKENFNVFRGLIKIERSALGQSQSTKKKKNRKVTYLGLALIILLVSISLYNFSKDIILELDKMGKRDIFISFILITAFIFSLVNIIITSARSVLNDKTNALLNSMPISSKKRFLAVVLMHIQNSYSIYAMLISIPIIYFGIVSKQGLIYYLASVFSMLVMPIAPSIICFALVFLIFKTFRKILSKKTFKYLSIAIYGILIFLYLMLISSMGSGEELATKISQFTNVESINALNWYPTQFANIITGKDSGISFLIILAINISSFLIIINYIGKRYLNILLDFTDIGEGIGLFANMGANKKKRQDKIVAENIVDKEKSLINKESKSKKNKKKDLDNLKSKDFKQKRLAISYILREAGFFIKHPVILLNSILSPLIFIVIFIAGMIQPIRKDMKEIKESPNMILVSEKKELIEDEYLEIDEFKLKDREIYEIKDKDGNPRLFKTDYSLLSEKEYEKILSNRKEEFTEKAIKDNDMFLEIQKYNIEEFLQNKEENINKIMSTIETEAKKHNLSEEEIKGIKYHTKREIKESELLFSEKSVLAVLFKLPQVQDKDYILEGMPNILKFFVPIIIFYVLSIFMTISVYMFSKDKDNYFLLKTIPVKASAQFRYKRLFGIIMKMIFFILFMLIYSLMLKPEILINKYTILGTIIGIIITIIIESIQLLIDAKYPTTTWSTPAQLTKNSAKSFISILGTMLIGVIVGTSMFWLVNKKAYITADTYMYIFIAVIVITFIAVETYIHSTKDRLLEKLE